MIIIQHEDFLHAQEYEQLRSLATSDGAIVTFTGIVRDFSDKSDVVAIELEHYPEMTQKSLEEICQTARSRWPLGQIKVIHRVGKILAMEQIVFVGVTSKHREAAFAACQFIMDHLKTSVPIWKKEIGLDNEIWVEAKASDDAAREKWQS